MTAKLALPVALIAIGFAVLPIAFAEQSPTPVRKLTVEDLKAMSKEIELDNARNVVRVNMSCLRWATDEKLRIIDQFPTIVQLRAFGGGDLTDDGLRSITNLPNLTVLEIKSTAVTDAGLMHLQKMTSLQKLDLKAPAVTDRAVAELRAALPNCEISR